MEPPDGRWLATGGLDRDSRVFAGVFPTQPEDLIADACSRLTRNLTLDEWRQYLGEDPYRATCPSLPLAATPTPTPTAAPEPMPTSTSTPQSYASPTATPPPPETPSPGPLPVEIVEAGNVDRLAHWRTLSGHASAVSSVAFSPDGQLLASDSGGHIVRP